MITILTRKAVFAAVGAPVLLLTLGTSIAAAQSPSATTAPTPPATPLGGGAATTTAQYRHRR